MVYRQTYIPNVNVGAVRGWCLGYVDDALNAPERSYSAQIAYNRAVARGWVRGDYNFPRDNVWIVLFWSIDNGAQAGLGHVALAFIGSDGAMQIHDSEVHAGARNPYGSLQELQNWFGSTQLTFLGWSIGVDGRKILETPEETSQQQAEAQRQAELEAQRQAEEAEAKRQAEIIEQARLAEEKRRRESIMSMPVITRIIDDGFKAPFVKDSVWFWSMETGFINLPTRRDYEWLDTINKYTTGKPVFRQQSSKETPFHLRLAVWNPSVNVKEAKACIEDNIQPLTD